MTIGAALERRKKTPAQELRTSKVQFTAYRKCNQNTLFSDSKSSIHGLSMSTSGGTGENSQQSWAEIIIGFRTLI